ncbi:hypothetical protein TRFO_09486 [Tritrichomonas foetus]|uniref:Uncharacterized protein n=1 Tax=Tritrichomonas foetus TaxID=1144522 RepID=A0A1J4JEC8_9EUKA|nr:hypothetical protein TRFO_09486 [Tritrichomonas foetus]|eukprot:OHS97464.1 hypothetical protein TRFO_09486 [Tritrichomonas foetus]
MIDIGFDSPDEGSDESQQFDCHDNNNNDVYFSQKVDTNIILDNDIQSKIEKLQATFALSSSSNDGNGQLNSINLVSDDFVDFPENEFSFELISKVETLMEKGEFNEIDNMFESKVYLDKFINYFIGLLGVTTRENQEMQLAMTDVLSYVLFSRFEQIPNFASLGSFLLVGHQRKGIKPIPEQKIIALRWFYRFFNTKWFSIQFNETDSIVLHLFKNISPEADPFYITFLKFIVPKLPNNSKYIKDYSEALAKHPIFYPDQLEYHYHLISKSQEDPPYFSFFALIKYSVSSPFSRLAKHYLIPALIDYSSSPLIMRAIWNYTRRLVQFSIVSQIMQINQTEIREIYELLNQFYNLRIPKLSQMVMSEVATAQKYNCFMEVKFPNIKKASIIDNTLLDELYGLKPSDINVMKLLDLPVKYIPIKKERKDGVMKIAPQKIGPSSSRSICVAAEQH